MQPRGRNDIPAPEAAAKKRRSLFPKSSGVFFALSRALYHLKVATLRPLSCLSSCAKSLAASYALSSSIFAATL
jgi:hypothetical protein